MESTPRSFFHRATRSPPAAGRPGVGTTAVRSARLYPEVMQLGRRVGVWQGQEHTQAERRVGLHREHHALEDQASDAWMLEHDRPLTLLLHLVLRPPRAKLRADLLEMVA